MLLALEFTKTDDSEKTHWIIFNLSRGLTTVLEAAPAHPPARQHIAEALEQHLSCSYRKPTNSPTKYEAMSGLKNMSLRLSGGTKAVDEDEAPWLDALAIDNLVVVC